jgi:hypothetical protein
MKNIHILPTSKPSRLHYFTANKAGYYLYPNNGLVIPRNPNCINQNIYITSDEEIKEGVDQWYLDKFLNKPMNSGGAQYGEKQNVIILTTDQDLIADGVQAIDDEFLEWFVKNPSCEYVEVENQYRVKSGTIQEHIDGIAGYEYYEYKIIIPQQEHEPIHKFNNGRGATLCGKCRVIISEGLTKELYCERCKPKQCNNFYEGLKHYFETTPKEKAQQLYEDAYTRWCHELSHDKNVLTAKSICEYVCNEVLGDMGADRGYEFWTSVRDIIKKSNHSELFNKKD